MRQQLLAMLLLAAAPATTTAGERQNGIMNGFAAALADDEIRALAEHYGEG